MNTSQNDLRKRVVQLGLVYLAGIVLPSPCFPGAQIHAVLAQSHCVLPETLRSADRPQRAGVFASAGSFQNYAGDDLS